MVGDGDALPLPWLAAPLRELSFAARGHALLLHGPRGVGQFELALVLAQAWLCEDDARADRSRPCGRCAGCRLMLARSHPDLLVLLPETLREPLGWLLDDEVPAAGDAKRKPSREIKVDAVRAVVAFAQRTASRGGAKVVVVHPAEAMNAVAANTLLKTLEEPPRALRFVLCSAAPDDLPATVRSRCQPWRLAAPPRDQALEWLKRQSLDDADVMLAATGGQPLEALNWQRDGIEARTWVELAEAVRRGDASALSRWTVPRVLEALAKLCHDTACVTLGAPPRWFDAAHVRPARDLSALLRWSRELARIEVDAEHPWNAPLLIETLVTQGRRALT
jgi:DNA polymerase-3 subunit delta'